jgi:hypothetical protein
MHKLLSRFMGDGFKIALEIALLAAVLMHFHL